MSAHADLQRVGIRNGVHAMQHMQGLDFDNYIYNNYGTLEIDEIQDADIQAIYVFLEKVLQVERKFGRLKLERPPRV